MIIHIFLIEAGLRKGSSVIRFLKIEKQAFMEGDFSWTWTSYAYDISQQQSYMIT